MPKFIVTLTLELTAINKYHATSQALHIKWVNLSNYKTEIQDTQPKKETT